MVELANNDWLPKDIYRSARRIELLRRPASPCSCTKLPCSRAGCLQYPTSSRVQPDEFLNEEYSHVEALLAHHTMWFGRKLPQPGLRLLSWSLLGQHHDTNYSTLHNLTHLFLSDICHGTLKTIVGEILLPQTTMLRLDFIAGSSGHFKPDVTFTSWRFPKLERLMLGGTCQEELLNGIKGLIVSCGITIRELGVTMRISWKEGRYPGSYIGEILDNLPNLVTFGTVWADRYPRPSWSKNPTWSLLLFHIPKSFESNWSIPLERIVLEYGAKKVIFDNTWQDIRVTMDNEKYDLTVSKYFRSALDTMEEGAILVCDINGIPSTESYGRDFRSWLGSRYEMVCWEW
jgi:hypothetical protein